MTMLDGDIRNKKNRNKSRREEMMGEKSGTVKKYMLQVKNAQKKSDLILKKVCRL